MSIVTYSEDMQTVYVRINWVNQPSTSTALGATNLNKMDFAISVIDGRVVALNTTKLDKSTANTMVHDIDLDANGVFTIKKLDGTTKTYDTKLEKLAVNFEYDAVTQRLVITLDDGTKQYVDMSALITEFEFIDTATIAFTKNSTGKMSADVKNGSITEAKLQPNYLADIKVQAQNASNSATASAQSRDQSQISADKSKQYMDQAKTYRDEAEDISGVGVATDAKLGLVKGNGNIEVRVDGAMWADPHKDKATALTGTFITCPVADDGLLHVKEMSGETVQKVTVEGKNLFASPLKNTVTIDGVTFTYNPIDGSILINGTSTSNISLVRLFSNGFSRKLVLADGTYTYKTNYVSGTVSGTLNSSITNASTTLGAMDLSPISTGSNTKTITGGEYYFGIYIATGTILNNVLFKPQLEPGTTATTYEPFSPNSPSPEYPSPLEYAKDFNLMSSNINIIPFPYANQSRVLAGITYTVNSDGTIRAVGTSTGYNVFNLLGDVTSNYTSLKFIFKKNIKYIHQLGVQLKYRKTDGGYGAINNNTVFIPSDDILVGCLYFESINIGETIDKTFYPQLEIGASITQYTTNKSDKKSISFPFMSVPDGTKNELSYDVSGKFTSRIRVKEIELTGTENWVISGTSNNIVGSFALNTPDAINGYDSTLKKARSTHFLAGTHNETVNSTANKPNYISLDSGTTNRFIRITSDFAFTVADFKAWLVQQKANGTPVKVQYAIKDVIVTEFDPIYLKSFKGTTHLFTNSYPQVKMLVDFKSELWSRDYLQDVALENAVNEVNTQLQQIDAALISISGEYPDTPIANQIFFKIV